MCICVYRYICAFCVLGVKMENQYINKDELLNLIEKLIQARAKKANCSKGAAAEFNAYKNIYRYVNSLKTYTFNQYVRL